MKKIDLLEALKNKPNLVKKIKAFLATLNSTTTSKDTTRSNSPMIKGVGPAPTYPNNPNNPNNKGLGEGFLTNQSNSEMDEEKQIHFHLPADGTTNGDNQGVTNKQLHMEF